MSEPTPYFQVKVIPAEFNEQKKPSAAAAAGKKDFINLDFTTYDNFTPFSHRNVNQLTEPFELIVGILRTLGNSPITVKKTYSGKGGHPKLSFEVGYWSPAVIAGACIACPTLVLFTLFFFNIGLGYSFLISDIISYKDFDALLREEESSQNPVRGMVQRTYCITAAIVIVEIISRWWHAKKFVHFLNKWELFERKLAGTFPSYDYDYEFSGLYRLRDNLLLFYVTYPSMVLITAFLVVYCSRLNVIVKVMGVCVMFQFIAVSLLEDVKVILSYKTLQEAYHQVRRCIVHFSQTKSEMTAEVALSWRQLVQMIREQCERASRCQKFEELFRLIGYTGLVTMFVYIILNGWEHSQKRGSMLFLLSSLGYGAMLMGRIYFKAVMADSIAQEEAAVSRAVLKLDTKSCDIMTVLELKCLLETITLSPAKISFGNYIVLNKRLLLGVCGQIVTYLIVMMQFSQSPNIKS